jgi:hypothetical protein
MTPLPVMCLFLHMSSLSCDRHGHVLAHHMYLSRLLSFFLATVPPVPCTIVTVLAWLDGGTMALMAVV